MFASDIFAYTHRQLNIMHATLLADMSIFGSCSQGIEDSDDDGRPNRLEHVHICNG